MLRFAFVLAAAALVPIAPTYAADSQTLDCIEKTIDAPSRKLLEADFERNLRHPENEQQYGEESQTALTRATATCQTRFGWGDKAAEAALLYAMPALGLPVAKRLAAASKLDYAAIEARFLALPPSEQRDALSEAVLDKLATGAIAAGEIDDATASLAGAIFGLLATREQGRSDFAAN